MILGVRHGLADRVVFFPQPHMLRRRAGVQLDRVGRHTACDVVFILRKKLPRNTNNGIGFSQ